MPKKTKKTTATVQVAPGTARELENHLGYELSGWAETFGQAAAEGDAGRDAVNELLAELHTLLVERDAVIDASESGTLNRRIFEKHAATFVAEVRNEYPEMSVPEGTLGWHASRINAAFAASRELITA